MLAPADTGHPSRPPRLGLPYPSHRQPLPSSARPAAILASSLPPRTKRQRPAHLDVFRRPDGAEMLPERGDGTGAARLRIANRRRPTRQVSQQRFQRPFHPDLEGRGRECVEREFQRAITRLDDAPLRRPVFADHVPIEMIGCPRHGQRPNGRSGAAARGPVGRHSGRCPRHRGTGRRARRSPVRSRTRNPTPRRARATRTPASRTIRADRSGDTARSRRTGSRSGRSPSWCTLRRGRRFGNGAPGRREVVDLFAGLRRRGHRGPLRRHPRGVTSGRHDP